MTAPIRFSAGRNTFDNTPEQMEVSGFDRLVDHLDTHRGQKKGQNYVCGPMASGPHNDTDKHPRDAHFRLARHAEPCSFLPLDIDHMDGGEVQNLVLEVIKGFRSYAYETASSTPQNPRMRVIMELDREVSRDERMELGEAIEAEIGARIEADFGQGAIVFDPSVYRPEQPNYNPTEGAKSWRFLGAPALKVDEVLAGASRAQQSERRAGQGGSRTLCTANVVALGPLPDYLAARSSTAPKENPFVGATRVLKTPFLLAQIESALSVIPSKDRGVWVKVGHSAKTLDEDGGNEGKGLWLPWSRTAFNYDPEDAERAWASFNPTHTSHEEIFRVAEKYGWDVQSENARISATLGEASKVQGIDARQDVSKEQASGCNISVTSYGDDLLGRVQLTPRRDWKIPGLLLSGYISLTVGPGGVAKSMLQLIAAVSVATGRDLLGLGRVRQCNALVINNEDDEDELRRRISAILMQFGIGPSELDGTLFTVSGYENPVHFALYVANSVLPSPTANYVKALIEQHEVGALFVDPFISAHTVPENDNNAMDRVVSVFKRLAGESRIAINIAHHTRKTGGDAETIAGDADAGRGASSIKDAARAAVTIARMGQKTANKLGVTDEERGSYIRMDVGKMNFAAHDSKANWFRIESVRIPNGDMVGVPVPVNLDHLFAAAKAGSRKWSSESMAHAVCGLFPSSAQQVPWANVKSRFMSAYAVGKSAAADCITLLPQEGEPPARAGQYQVWISRSAPNNGWMIHRQEVSDA